MLNEEESECRISRTLLPAGILLEYENLAQNRNGKAEVKCESVAVAAFLK